MAKKAAIPQDTREWPDYEYRGYPKWVGRDEYGQDLIANSAEEAEHLAARKVYPIDLGYDKQGNLVQSLHPDDTAIRKTWVTRPMDKVAEGGNKLTGDGEKTALQDENARLREQLAALEKAQEVPAAETGKSKKKAA